MKRSTATICLILLMAGGAGLVALHPMSAQAAFSSCLNGRVAFESGRSDELDIYSVEPGGGGLRRLTGRFAVDQGAAWNPSGTRIVFYRSPDYDSAGDLWIMNSDGSHKRRLTSTPADDRDPAWSPNGRRIVFVRAHNGNVDLYSVRASDGGGLRRLTSNPAADVAPVWGEVETTSGSGGPAVPRIAFTSFRSGNGDIYSMKPDGSHLKRLTSGANADLYPDWSAPGWGPHPSKVVFFEERNGSLASTEIHVMLFDGTHEHRLTRNSVADDYAAWSPDGRRIVWQSDRNHGFYDLWIMSSDGSHKHAVMSDGFVDGRPDWAVPVSPPPCPSPMAPTAGR